MDRRLARVVFATLAHTIPPRKLLLLFASIALLVNTRIKAVKLLVKARCAYLVRSQRRHSSVAIRPFANDAPQVRIQGGKWGQFDAQAIRAHPASLVSVMQRVVHAQAASSKTYQASTVARVRVVSLENTSPHTKGRRRQSNAAPVQLVSIRMNLARTAARASHADLVNILRLLV